MISVVAQVDLIDFSGPTFKDVDNRVAALRLVQHGLTESALFDPAGAFLLFFLVPCQHLASLYSSRTVYGSTSCNLGPPASTNSTCWTASGLDVPCLCLLPVVPYGMLTHQQ